MKTQASLENRVISTRRGYYYVSRYRRLGRYPMWVGPFTDEKLALAELIKDPEEIAP